MLCAAYVTAVGEPCLHKRPANQHVCPHCQSAVLKHAASIVVRLEGQGHATVGNNVHLSKCFLRQEQSTRSTEDDMQTCLLASSAIICSAVIAAAQSFLYSAAEGVFAKKFEAFEIPVTKSILEVKVCQHDIPLSLLLRPIFIWDCCPPAPTHKESSTTATTYHTGICQDQAMSAMCREALYQRVSLASCCTPNRLEREYNSLAISGFPLSC